MTRDNQCKGGRHAQGEIREAWHRGRLQRPPLLVLDSASSGPARPRVGPFPFLFRLIFLVPVLVGAAASGGAAHGGPPLRVGVPPSPDLVAVGRLALSHLRDGIGFAVVWKEYPDEASLREAFRAGKVDIAVAGAGGPAAGDGEPAAPCTPDGLARLREALSERWGGEVFPLAAVSGGGACRPPALLVARGVLEDLRFGILGKEAARVAAFTTGEDVAAVRSAEASGGERAAAAAVRAVLAAKAKR